MRNDWRRGGKGGKGVGDDEATQVPAASAKMESGKATTDSEREGEKGRGGRARETATNFSAGFLDDLSHSLAR